MEEVEETVSIMNASGDKNYNQAALYCMGLLTAEDIIAGDRNEGEKMETSGLFDKLKKRDDNYYGDVKDEKEEENKEDERSCHRWAEWLKTKMEQEVKVMRPFEREMKRLNEELKKIEMENVEENEEEKNMNLHVKRCGNDIKDKKRRYEVMNNMMVTPNAADNNICDTSEEDEGTVELNIRVKEEQAERLMTLGENMKVRLIDFEDNDKWWTSESDKETDCRDEESYEEGDVEEADENYVEEQRGQRLVQKLRWNSKKMEREKDEVIRRREEEIVRLEKTVTRISEEMDDIIAELEEEREKRCIMDMERRIEIEATERLGQGLKSKWDKVVLEQQRVNQRKEWVNKEREKLERKTEWYERWVMQGMEIILRGLARLKRGKQRLREMEERLVEETQTKEKELELRTLDQQMKRTLEMETLEKVKEEMRKKDLEIWWKLMAEVERQIGVCLLPKNGVNTGEETKQETTTLWKELKDLDERTWRSTVSTGKDGWNSDVEEREEMEMYKKTHQRQLELLHQEIRRRSRENKEGEINKDEAEDDQNEEKDREDKEERNGDDREERMTAERNSERVGQHTPSKSLLLSIATDEMTTMDKSQRPSYFQREKQEQGAKPKMYPTTQVIAGSQSNLPAIRLREHQGAKMAQSTLVWHNRVKRLKKEDIIRRKTKNEQKPMQRKQDIVQEEEEETHMEIKGRKRRKSKRKGQTLRRKAELKERKWFGRKSDETAQLIESDESA